MKTIKKIIEKERKEDELTFGGYSEDALKNSAIEDIKAIKKAINSNEEYPELLKKFKLYFCKDNDPKNLKDWKGHLMSIESYIKWKFGIKEEDLK